MQIDNLVCDNFSNTFVQNKMTKKLQLIPKRSSERLLYNPDIKYSNYSLILWHKIFAHTNAG